MRQLLCFSILLCSIACDKQDPGFFPLQSGLNWQYNIEKRTVHGQVQQKEIINSLGSKDAQNTFVLNSINGTQYQYLINDAGVYLEDSIDPAGEPALKNSFLSTVFNFPLVVGTQWQDFITTRLIRSYDIRAEAVIESVPVTVEIESISDTVRIPAGKYKNCIRIVSIGSKYIQKAKYAYQPDMTISVKNTRWYAAGTGLVKETQVESSDILQYPEGDFIKTLTKFY
jgi:hypothetical protein